MIEIAGYQVNEKIYESARSVVYRAEQKKDGQPVILKTLKEQYPQPAEIMRYRREYEIIQSFDFDGIPRAVGLEKLNNRLALITEDVGGRDLKHLLTSHTFTLGQLLNIAGSLARILGEIHAANFIHTDIKSANVILNPEADRLQVIDFGSVRSLSGAGSIGELRGLAGTLSYMSPEQTGRMNRQVDWRTDLYSLGVTLYELFTGRLPFETTDALELVHAHIARQPPKPAAVDGEVPDGVSDIIIKLLAKNPDARYQSATGLEADLAECLQRLEGTGRIRSFPLARQDVSDKFQISRELVGRRKELAALTAAYERVSRGDKKLMLIAGPSGIGKTALVMEAGEAFARREAIFLKGHFDLPDRNVPFAAFVTAFHDMIRRLLTGNAERLAVWRDRILAALGQNGQILIDLIPEAESVIGPQPPVIELEPAAAQKRIEAVLLNFIRIFCRPEHPLVLFLDDLSQAIDSLDMVKSLMSDEGIDFLLLIGAYRDEEVETGHPLLQCRETLAQQGHKIEQLSPASLSAEHIARICAATLKSNHRRTEPLARILMEKTRDNPYFLIEFLYLLSLLSG